MEERRKLIRRLAAAYGILPVYRRFAELSQRAERMSGDLEMGEQELPGLEEAMTRQAQALGGKSPGSSEPEAEAFCPGVSEGGREPKKRLKR